MITRTPRECLLACIANLEMARDAADAAWVKACDGGDQDTEMHAQGELTAFQQALQLISVECQSILQEPDHG